MKRLIAISLLLSLSLAGQSLRRNRFSTYKETTLSSAAEAVTIQQPSSSARVVYFELANIYCSVACTVELERGGTAATTTALSTVAVGNQGQSSRANAFHTSDVGNGSTVTEFDVAAGETMSVDLSGMILEGADTTENVTFRTNTISGDVKITVVWWEG